MSEDFDARLGVDSRVRDGLRLLTELLLPGTETLPPGVEVGAHADLLDRSLAANPRLAPAVLELGRRAAERGSVTMEEFLGWDPALAEEVAFVLIASYLMSDRAREALHYPGQGGRPVAAATASENYDEALLEPVISRGPRYVPTPD